MKCVRIVAVLSVLRPANIFHKEKGIPKALIKYFFYFTKIKDRQNIIVLHNDTPCKNAIQFFRIFFSNIELLDFFTT